MDGMFMALVSIIIITLAGVVFTIAYYAVGSMVSADIQTAIKEATLMAVLHTSGDEYYVEVVWTGPVIPPRYFVLSNGQLVTPPKPYQCGIGYAPAPYRYCLYILHTTARPIGLVLGG